MRKIGATGVAAALSGPTAAAERASIADLDVERELDVASVDGLVAIGELLEPHEIAALPDGIDPAEPIAVAAEADTITVQDCCDPCCSDPREACDCVCCECPWGCGGGTTAL